MVQCLLQRQFRRPQTPGFHQRQDHVPLFQFSTGYAAITIGMGGQSQRDCVLQPRVARNELPWVRTCKNSATPTGLWLGRAAKEGTTPLGLVTSLRRLPRVARSSQPLYVLWL